MKLKVPSNPFIRFGSPPTAPNLKLSGDFAKSSYNKKYLFCSHHFRNFKGLGDLCYECGERPNIHIYFFGESLDCRFIFKTFYTVQYNTDTEIIKYDYPLTTIQFKTLSLASASMCCFPNPVPPPAPWRACKCYPHFYGCHSLTFVQCFITQVFLQLSFACLGFLKK